jgi:hypothetical protein
VAVGINPLAYNSLWRLRSDAWSSLEESGAQPPQPGGRCRGNPNSKSKAAR